jgi:asparagine synthase (glutamine-hydrolysing)
VFKPGALLTYTCDDNNINECEFTIEFQESRIVDLLRKSVIKRIDNSDRPVAFLCSGGLDSSLILCLAHEYLQQQKRELHVFSMKYTGTSGQNVFSEDEFYCKRLVELLGVKYTSLSFSFEEVKNSIDDVIYQTETYDPNTIRTSIANYLLAKKLRETTDYKVFLSGEGADELFCGYLYFNQSKDGIEINKESDRLVQNIHMFDILKADRCFSAFGLEVRVPFLDKKFVSFVKSIDGKYKTFINHTEKFLLRNAFKKQFTVLSDARIIDRPKERFSDGVSFSYVPDLLNFCSNSEESVLDNKELREKQYYRNIFDKYYPNMSHVIIDRTMPSWCTNLKQIVTML